jgi:hypothetical protein
VINRNLAVVCSDETMRASIKMAPAVVGHPGARTTKEGFVIEHRIPPAGDPFYAASLGSHRIQDQADAARACFCGCYEGVVYLGEVVLAEDGEEVEVIEAVPCRRAAAKPFSPAWLV